MPQLRNYKRAAKLLGYKVPSSVVKSRQHLSFGAPGTTAPGTPKKTKEEELLEQIEAMKRQMKEKDEQLEKAEKEKEEERREKEEERRAKEDAIAEAQLAEIDRSTGARALEIEREDMKREL